ncbi:MAG: hypothetical protein EP338_00385 [Bacteroidetes bacterium]|nr:MAG: hypothetical protein EP338_00385 [Bacteroidota bacterium]
MSKLKIRRREQVMEKLSGYLPDGFEEMVAGLIFEYPVRFKIVRPRTSKLGDFRPPHREEKARITVNGNLNQYSFLITTLHEFAHYHTFLEYGNRVKAHGEEWKMAYRKLLLPLIESEVIPEGIKNALENSLIRTKASSCSDIPLMRELKKYDQQRDGLVFLEEIPKNSVFLLNGRQFLKGELRRKRYLCHEITTKKQYLVHALSEVRLNEKE